MRIIFLLISFFIIHTKISAQFSVPPLDNRINNVMFYLLQKDTVIDISWMPLYVNLDNKYFIDLNIKSSFFDYLINRNNLDYKKNDFSMHLNLLGNLSFVNKQEDETRYYRNTRGFEIFGQLGENLFYYTKFLENQAVFVPYINEYIDSMVIVPGEGWWKNFGENGRDYTYAMGYVVYKPFENLFLEIGHGKNFIGNGYRSLILSDNSFIYPYLKLEFVKGHFSFTNMWSQMYNFFVRYYFYHYTKHSTFSSFTYFNQNVNISFIIATNWKTSDYQTFVNHFPITFFVPPIAPLIYGLDSENNSLLAVNFSYRWRFLLMYSQVVLDNIDLSKSIINTSNRYACQIGIRSYDILKNKWKNLHLSMLTEFNYVRPYTYASEFRFQGFYHYNQPIAHPLGASFKELIFRISLWIYNLELQYNYSLIKTSTLGQNIFDTQISMLNLNIDGAAKITHNFFKLSFIINSHTGMRMFLGVSMRDKSKDYSLDRSFYKFIGLTTDLGRFYYDF